jgi:hypothetical protein
MSITSPTYRYYQELLHAQRAKKAWSFLDGWTKAGRCEMVASEILERLTWDRDKGLLLAVLDREIIPNVNAKCRDKIAQQLKVLFPGPSQSQQKRDQLQELLGKGEFTSLISKVSGEVEKTNLIDQLHTFFFEKLKECNAAGSCARSLEKLGRSEIVDFVSLLNRIDLPVEHVRFYINQLFEMVDHIPNGISELLHLVPAKTAVLTKLLELSQDSRLDLLQIIKEAPDKEALIDQLHTLFVDLQLKRRAHTISSGIEELKKIPRNQLTGFVSVLNCMQESDSHIRNNILLLREVNKYPGALQMIPELLNMVPAKAGALLKIIKSSHSIGAVPSLLKILKSASPLEQKETLIDQLSALFVEPRSARVESLSLYKYLASFEVIPENERLDFIHLLNDLLLSDTTYNSHKIDDYIQFLKNSYIEEIKRMADQTKYFLANLRSHGLHYTPYDALTFLRSIPEEEMRRDFLTKLPTLLEGVEALHCPSELFYSFLFANEEDRINQLEEANRYMWELPIQRKITLLLQSQRLYAGLHPLVSKPLDAVALLKEKIAENERENFIAQIPGLAAELNRLDGVANDVKLQVLLFIFQEVPLAERGDFVPHLCNLRVSNIVFCLRTLLATPVNERANWVEAMNLQHESENARRPPETLTIDPADFSDEARNPTRPLLQLFAQINKEHRFPRIKYQNSEGIDEGGLTRDFVSNMFQALCHPDQKSLPLIESDGRYFPKVEEAPLPALLLEDQIKCFRAIGMLFARALNGDCSLRRDSVTTGAHFHPTLFAMIHALTLDDLIPEVPADVPNIKEKLTKLYLKAQFPQLFGSDSDGEIVALINGEVSQELQARGVDEEFLKDYHVNSIIQATLLIAKSMHKNLTVPNQWADADIIGDSPEILSKKIEGSLSSDLVISAFGLESEAEDTRKGMVKRWVLNASPEELKNFIFALTGSTSLSPGQKLGIHLCEALNNPENAPVFHTCGQYMDLPNYPTYELFASKLAISIASALAGGFQIG